MPFTYLIGWSAMDRYYYGARWAANSGPDDLWTTYFTSSKHVKKFRELHGEPDIVLIKKLFNTVNECRNHEERVLRKLKVTKNERWLNKGYNGKFLPVGPKSEEHQRKISLALQGHAPTRTGPHSEESKTKMSMALKGKKKSNTENMHFRIMNSTQLTCPHCGKTGQATNMKRWHFDKCKTA